MRRRQQRDTMGVLLLLNHVVYQIGLDVIPPVTLAIVVAQACTFLGLVDLPWRSPAEACISVDKVVFRGQWWRILFAAFEHGDSFHLYYNMVSFIWKGIRMETELGSAYFLYIVCLFTGLTGVTLVGLSYLCGMFVNPSFNYQCAVGFSAVIFALKVLNNHYWPGISPTIMGMSVSMPSGLIVWAELVLIQLVTPNASFLGHLAGILVGLAYVHDIVKPLADLIWRLLGQGPVYIARGVSSPRRRWQRSLGAFRIPVGAALISSALVAHKMRLLPVFLSYKLNNPCVNSYLVLKQERWEQLLVPALHTYNSMHLLYTVVSLLGLGFYLERRLGTVQFALTTLAATVATNLAYCLMTHFVLPYAKEIDGIPHFEMEYKCFLGMTGALMALKVIYSYYYPYAGYLLFFIEVPVPKFIGLVLEIALLHFLLPHVWIVGNVVGFAVGIVYVFCCMYLV
ncbi:hypothetical protein IscW_ISCW006085 [Ixodes scapularis]|uniref:Peptidase S54 rhomboid domain-containing protein n=1 Tax=Ixodes scapularis TaxID=6945 RepID=B7PP60_IXOSC|nr:hypothetical protein IscW_ISCW006085 [Ixodes scapularis]|eukprot:XP_002435552.1 hypothetical protein IscW_ISCW006085 [Ixodes scapularis]